MLTLILSLLITSPVQARENCTELRQIGVCPDSLIKEKVQWACSLLEEYGKQSVSKINDMRFECCGEPNYVWINNHTPKMIIHPLKPIMNGMNLSEEKDSSGKSIFVEFSKVAQKNPPGGWVEYEWPKFGDKVSTPKKSWVRNCKPKDLSEAWVVGSGTWK